MRSVFFANFLKKLRTQRGLTMDVLAKKCGIQRGYISGIESGSVNPPSPKLVKRLATKLKGDADYMLLLAWVDKAPKEIRAYLVEKLLQGVGITSSS